MKKNAKIDIGDSRFLDEEIVTPKVSRMVKLLREQEKYSVEQISEFLGISRRQYYRYETAESSIPIDQLIKLSWLYKCSLDMFTQRIRGFYALHDKYYSAEDEDSIIEYRDSKHNNSLDENRYEIISETSVISDYSDIDKPITLTAEEKVELELEGGYPESKEIDEELIERLNQKNMGYYVN